VVVEQDAELVFGGHPAITPMIACRSASPGPRVSAIASFCSKSIFPTELPPDNKSFERVEIIDHVPNDLTRSVALMRQAMLADPFDVGIFIGGMDGVEDEYNQFREKESECPGLASRIHRRGRGRDLPA